MHGYRRYAIYYAPPTDSALAAFGAAWLGWDAETGLEVAQPQIAGLPSPVDEITQTPRKYGFHGTLKPPFRLAPGATVDQLHARIEDVTGRLAPIALDGLRLAGLGRFAALVPDGDAHALAQVAGTLVTELDDLRDPLTEAELAKRRKSGLSPNQEAMLVQWGYPYVLDEFRFHLTLSGALPGAASEAVVMALAPHLSTLVPKPWPVRDVCLFGEAEDGRFHILHRYPLGG